MAEKKLKKINVQERLSEELGIPKTIVSGFNHIEFFGNREAVVNGCEGILEYSGEKIKINIGKNTIQFNGSNLCIREYGTSQAKISGVIMTVEFG